VKKFAIGQVSYQLFKSFVYITLLICTSCTKEKGVKEEEKTPLKVNFTQEPTTFDSIKASDYVSTSLQFFIGEGLTRMLPNQPVAMGIADHIEISSDRKVYTFYIRKAKWSDGSLVTAFDFERAWKKALRPDQPCSNSLLFFSILGAKKAKLGGGSLDDVAIKALNSSTLEVTLERPTEHFLQITSFCTLFPVHENPKVFCGPYIIESYKPEHSLILKKNPYYWDAKSVACQSIHISLIKDSDTAFELFKKNELDLIGMPFTPLPSEVNKQIDPSSSICFQSSAATNLISFNLTHPFLANLNLRKAICYAIDKNAITDYITQLNELPASNLIPPVLHAPKKYSDSFSIQSAKFHLKLALEELHISKEDLEHLRLCYSSSSSVARSAELIEAQIFEALGFHVRLQPLDQKMFMENLFKREFDLSICTIVAQYFDPMNFLERFCDGGGVRNYPNFQSTKYNEIISKISKESIASIRDNYIEQAEEILQKELPVFPLYYNSTAYITNPSIENVQTNPTGGLFLTQVRCL
jgi:ABC-type oligopeptide transport system substrate-binding subunit